MYGLGLRALGLGLRALSLWGLGYLQEQKRVMFKEQFVLALACGPPLRACIGVAVVHGNRVFKFLALLFRSLPSSRHKIKW